MSELSPNISDTFESIF